MARCVRGCGKEEDSWLVSSLKIDEIRRQLTIEAFLGSSFTSPTASRFPSGLSDTQVVAFTRSRPAVARLEESPVPYCGDPEGEAANKISLERADGRARLAGLPRGESIPALSGLE